MGAARAAGELHPAHHRLGSRQIRDASGEIRTDRPYASLATPAVPVRTTGDLEHSWGPGLGIVTDGSRRYVYHTGNNVIFIADFIYGVEENLGYVLLTNSANGPEMVRAVERRVFGRDLHR